MIHRIVTAYVRNTLIAGVFFLPIVIASDRVWTAEDTAAFVTVGWVLGWMIYAILVAGNIR